MDFSVCFELMSCCRSHPVFSFFSFLTDCEILLIFIVINIKIQYNTVFTTVTGEVTDAVILKLRVWFLGSGWQFFVQVCLNLRGRSCILT